MRSHLVLALALAAVPLAVRAQVTVEHDHLIVEAGPFGARITEIAAIRIDGAPLADGELRLHVAAGAQNPRALDQQGAADGRLKVAGDSLVNAAELAPGLHQFQLQYELVDASPRLSLNLPRHYPTRALDILAPTGPVQLRAPGLTKAPPANFDGRSFEHYSGADLPAGFALELILERELPPERRHDRNALVLMTLVAALGLIWLSRLILVQRRAVAGDRTGPAPSQRRG